MTVMDPYTTNFSNFKIEYKLEYSLANTPRYRTVKRPSWLHPIKRVLWAHRYGQHLPERKVIVPNTNTMAKLTGVTG
jgi:hypothetical protein